jgi:hypothetical protein
MLVYVFAQNGFRIMFKMTALFFMLLKCWIGNKVTIASSYSGCLLPSIKPKPLVRMNPSGHSKIVNFL